MLQLETDFDRLFQNIKVKFFMKKIAILLGFGLLFITACLIYLVKNGIALRTSPQIKPSIISADFHNVPQGVFLRTFPDLQNAHFLLWGVSYDSPEVQKTILGMKEIFEKEIGKSVQLLFVGPDLTAEFVKNCERPCWVIVGPQEAHELVENPFLEKYIRPVIEPRGESYLSITWIDFDKVEAVSTECDAQKFLHLDCLKTVSLREVQKKIKQPDQRYFFMRKYLDHDYFLFVQKPI